MTGDDVGRRDGTQREQRGGDEGAAAVASLMSTPVGRRWLLKAGLTASALAAWGTGPGSAPAAASNPPPRAHAGQDRIVFQFALGSAAALADLTVHVSGERIALTPHTAASRAALRRQGSLFGKLDTGALTHYADLRLPRSRGLVLPVWGTRDGRRVLVAQHQYAPVQGLRQVALAAFQLQKSYAGVAGSPARQRRLGLDPARLSSWTEVADLDAIVDSEQTAVSLTMMHPNVATIAPVEVAATKSLLTQTPEVATLGATITNLNDNGEDYATVTAAVDAAGQPTQLVIGGQTTTFSSASLNTANPTLLANSKAAIVAGVLGVRDTGALTTVVSQPLDQLRDTKDTATRHTPLGVLPTTTPYPASGLQSASVTAQVQSPGLFYGTKTEVGGFSSGSLAVTLYNNYLRWVWVYVQYFDAGGKQLPNPSGTSFPHTDNAESVGLLPQIFTVLGVPIWDTNTLSTTLKFPDKATSARLLYCGLGSDAVGGGWTQYFTVKPYPAGNVAPSQEVRLPAITTGIFTIGLNAFALLIDIDISLAWKQMRQLLTSDIDDEIELIEVILARPTWASNAEVAAGALMAGALTFQDIEHNGLSNLGDTLAGLGTLIPKVLFQPAVAWKLFQEAGRTVLADASYQKVLDALPLVGMALSIAAAVGDALSLAEAIGEAVASPWVIANTISLSYPATVTVSKDPRAATWPVTARTWRIESTIDGTTALSPVTGTFNANGTSTADIVLHLTPPYGGATIRWSMVVLDASGHQVGTGAVQLKNDDPTQPAGTVAFAITELPAVVDSGTVFTRRVTTAWQGGSSGYGWIPAPPDTSTRATGQIQGVVGVTVSTRLGVVGMVWKQNDKYWLRGVPVGESGGSIRLGTATKQGYARRPYLFFDALVGDKDVGNHLLLEPDDTTVGYHVRSVAIDPATGSLSWDPKVSRGYFPLPVDDATLCSSGWVAALHTDSGRLGVVLPAPTPRPPLAGYSAGPGSQPGLLQSPTAVAVTPLGTLLVLEAGATRISAFDLHGNPVRYFGTGSKAAFTMPLPTGRTYLDLGIDGSNQIYVLSYSGDGSQASTYRLDVYQPDGTPLTQRSTGTNVAKLAVDYWRSIFAANYTPLLDTTTGRPHIDPALGVMEPSISRLDPADSP